MSRKTRRLCNRGFLPPFAVVGRAHAFVYAVDHPYVITVVRDKRFPMPRRKSMAGPALRFEIARLVCLAQDPVPQRFAGTLPPRKRSADKDGGYMQGPCRIEYRDPCRLHPPYFRIAYSISHIDHYIYKQTIRCMGALLFSRSKLFYNEAIFGVLYGYHGAYRQINASVTDFYVILTYNITYILDIALSACVPRA